MAMTTSRSEADVEIEIGVLADLNLPALRERWRKLYGSEPPVRMSPELMLRAVAWRIQEEAFGGLSPSLKAKLSSLANPPRHAGGTRSRKATTSAPGDAASNANANANANASSGSDLTPTVVSTLPSRIRRDRKVKPGTRFLREWNGRMIEVIAMADGRYLYGGEIYRSLSAIARAVTGTRWSGPAFFGIGTKPGGSRGKS